MKCRVLMAGTALREDDGISIALSHLLPALGQHCEVYYVSTSAKGVGRLVKLGIFVRALAQWSWELLRNRPDIVHLHLGHGVSLYRKALLMMLARLRGCPVVLHLHGGMPLKRAKFRSIARWITRVVFRRADLVLVLYAQAVTDLKRFIEGANQRIEVMSNGFHWQSSQTKTDHVNAKSSGTAKRTVLFLGELSAEKGVADLLHVAPEVIGAVPDARFVLGGRGPIKRWQELCRRLGIEGRTELPGWVAGSTKRSLLDEAKVFVLPSYEEQLPMAVIEAMAFGLPVVAARVGGMAELIEDGVNGFLIEPGDRAALAQRIKELLTDEPLRLQLSQAGQRRVQQDYDAVNRACQLAALYEQILQQRRVARPAQ